MKRILGFLLILLLLLALAIPVKLFLIGEPVDGEQLGVLMQEEGTTLTLNIATPASAIALRGWKYHQDGSTLYIRARKVLVSPLFRDGTYQTTIDTTLLTQIYLGSKRIWNAK